MFDQLKHRRLTMSVYIIWHIWKERGRRVFQDETMPALALSALVRDDLELLTIARGGQAISVVT